MGPDKGPAPPEGDRTWESGCVLRVSRKARERSRGQSLLKPPRAVRTESRAEEFRTSVKGEQGTVRTSRGPPPQEATRDHNSPRRETTDEDDEVLEHGWWAWLTR